MRKSNLSLSTTSHRWELPLSGFLILLFFLRLLRILPQSNQTLKLQTSIFLNLLIRTLLQSLLPSQVNLLASWTAIAPAGRRVGDQRSLLESSFYWVLGLSDIWSRLTNPKKSLRKQKQRWLRKNWTNPSTRTNLIRKNGSHIVRNLWTNSNRQPVSRLILPWCRAESRSSFISDLLCCGQTNMITRY